MTHPKEWLGNPLAAKLSLANIVVPKCNLGTRKKYFFLPGRDAWATSFSFICTLLTAHWPLTTATDHNSLAPDPWTLSLVPGHYPSSHSSKAF